LGVNNAKETRTIGTKAMDGGNSERRVYHGRMVSRLRPKEDTPYHDDHNDDKGLRRYRFAFRRQEAYYEWFEHPRHVYLSSGHFANKTTEARVTINVADL
jgi:hypothetical protein